MRKLSPERPDPTLMNQAISCNHAYGRKCPPPMAASAAGTVAGLRLKAMMNEVVI
jgi:hypothetical protein